MSLRIDISWEQISPFLDRLSGVLRIFYFFKTSEGQGCIEICKCKVKLSEGHLSYEAFDDDKRKIPSILLEFFYNDLYTILNSYYNGFKLSKNLYTWMDNSNKSLKEVFTKKFKNMSIEEKISFRNRYFKNVKIEEVSKLLEENLESLMEGEKKKNETKTRFYNK